MKAELCHPKGSLVGVWVAEAEASAVLQGNVYRRARPQ